MLPSKRFLLSVARIAVPVTLLWLLWQALDGAEVASTLGAAEPGWLVAALVLILLQNLLSALRWWLTATRLGQSFGRRRAVGEYFLSQFLNMTLPAGMLGDAGRAVRMSEDGLMRSGQAVIIDRLTGQAALFAVLFAGLGFVAVSGGGEAWPDWVGRFGLLALALVLGLGALLAGLRLAGTFAGRAAAGFARNVRRGVLEVWPRQLALSLAIVACNLGGFALCAAATGTDLPALAVVTVVPLVLATMVLPISIGGWGVREGAAAVLWPVLGAAPEAGVAASVAFGLVILAASVPGALVVVSGRGA